MQRQVIAARYARALEQVCNFDEIKSSYQIYNKISSAFHVVKFHTIMESNMVSKQKKLELIKSFVDTSFGTHAEKLLELLVKNDRISLIPFLTLELKKIIDSKQSVYNAILYSKEYLNAESLERIQNKLSKKLNITLNITQEIIPSMEGIALEVPDLCIQITFFKDRFIRELQDSILRTI